MVKYSYSVGQFPNAKANADRLTIEIQASNITIALDHITVYSLVDIYFKDTISSAEQTILDGIVAAHSGEAVEYIKPMMDDGRPIVRADSRPLGTETYFTCAGDGSGTIGDGVKMWWDFSNDDDIIPYEDPYPTMKHKRINVVFNDHIWLKEGTLYVMNALKGSYADFSIWSPPYYPYYDREGNPHYGGADGVLLYRYLHNHFFAGSVPMGDELNTEGCQQNGIPPGYYLRIDVYVPIEDNESYGWANLEMYRARTQLFPGESL